jgi:uncharacterized protein (DUF1684 family)
VDAAGALELLDWKRRIFELYAEVRRTPEPRAAWERWRAVRDELLRTHPQSPLPEAVRGSYPGMPFFDYDPACRVRAQVEPAPAEETLVGSSGDKAIAFERIARARFELLGQERVLELYWLVAYGGGLFVPFRDDTSGTETYGGGRYLLDTVKGSDLGVEAGRLVLDFNFAYNPSCSYDPRWICPLSPPANRLPVRIEAGEQLQQGR